MEIILASQSIYRRILLENFGLKIKAISPLVNEEHLKENGPKDLIELTRYLALHKANSLREQYPRAMILGCDQIAELDGERLDKPGTIENAIEQLSRLQGRAHRLITSLAMTSSDQTFLSTEVTTLTMRKLPIEMIQSYARQDQPTDCAGAYKIEKAGLSLMEKIETTDPSAIQGLPLTHLVRGFEKLGFNLQRHWENT